MTKKIPLRQCLGCGEHKEKKALIRVVRNKEGEIFLDPTGKAGGRGAYICKSEACLALAVKKKRMENAFGAPVPSAVLEALQKELKAVES